MCNKMFRVTLPREFAPVTLPGIQIRQEGRRPLEPVVLGVEANEKRRGQPRRANDRQISRHCKKRLADFGPALHQKIEGDYRNE